jgi:peptide/nickel transport system ATP-binding protein
MATETQGAPALSICGLNVSFQTQGKWRQVVEDVSLSVPKGRTLALIGESGSGKTVTLRSILQLLPPKTRIAGTIDVIGRNVRTMGRRDLADLRGDRVGFVFQEPLTALDPLFRIGDQIAETLTRHRGMSHREGWKRAKELLDLVQIPSAERRLRAYPSELSGGLRQRVMIAVAMSCEPDLLLADEPTTALDATVQAQVLLLLRDLQQQSGMAMVFVTHDLGAAAQIADEVAVMHNGRIVESGDAARVLLRPEHAYTRALTSCVVSGHYRDGWLNEGQTHSVA